MNKPEPIYLDQMSIPEHSIIHALTQRRLDGKPRIRRLRIGIEQFWRMTIRMAVKVTLGPVDKSGYDSESFEMTTPSGKIVIQSDASVPEGRADAYED